MSYTSAHMDQAQSEQKHYEVNRENLIKHDVKNYILWASATSLLFIVSMAAVSSTSLLGKMKISVFLVNMITFEFFKTSFISSGTKRTHNCSTDDHNDNSNDNNKNYHHYNNDNNHDDHYYHDYSFANDIQSKLQQQL